jgi:hypothetical protein
MRTRDDALAQIRAERDQWHVLLSEVGEERMEEPGPMGVWSFKDLAAHLTGWRQRTIARIEAGSGAEPALPWPGQLTTDDEINSWIYERNRVRPLGEVLAEADQSYERLAAAVATVGDEDLLMPGRFAWMEGAPLVEADFFGHLHEEHEPSIRAWLASR